MQDLNEQDPADGGRRPLPLLAVLIGAAVLAAMPLIVPRLAPATPLPTLVGAGAAVGLIFWLLALIGGLRRGPGWWTFAALALLVAGGALSGYNAGRIGHADSTADASTFAEVKLNPDTTPLLPSSPARGELSSAYVELVRANEADAKAQDERVAKLNPGVLNSPYMLAQAPAILRECAAIDALGTEAAAAAGRRSERGEGLASRVATAKLAPELRQGIAQMVTLPDGAIETLQQQERAAWQATRELCQLLAKRSWSNANGYFGFANSADKAAFDALNQRRIAVEEARKQLRDAIKARFEGGREQVRAALS